MIHGGMPFSYSCFISYRHTEYDFGRQCTKRFIDALKGQLEIAAPLPVFLDEDRLKGGEFYQESLAKQLCESACMVMLYWPTYFSTQHTFCSREFKLMERLEAERLACLPVSEQDKGLIIVVALADFDQLPSEIRSKRLCYNFEPYMLARNGRNHPQFINDMRNIRRYIAERSRILGAMPAPDPCFDCPNCRFPEHQIILPWVLQVLAPTVPYPTREPGR
jgi:hypothetical protein